MSIPKIRKLIKDECANFNYENNFCIPRDRPCSFYLNTDGYMRCGYFEKSVLPIDTILEREYRQDRNLGADENVIRCKSCNKYFRRKSNRQQHCDLCAKNINRDNARKRKQQSRV